MLLTKDIKTLIYTYLYTFAILMVLPFLINLLTGTLKYFSFTSILKNMPFGTVFSIYLIVISSISYESFKMFIQNGISRRTFFIGKLSTLMILILIGDFINLLFGYLIQIPLVGYERFNLFMGSYAGFFHNVFASVLFNYLMSGLLLICLVTFVMAFGSAMSLLSKRLQRLMVIGIPIIGIILIFIATSLWHSMAYKGTWMLNLFKLVVGFNAGNQLNPFPLISFLLVFSIVFAAIARFFFSKKQLKRE